MSLLVQWMCDERIRPAGAIRIRESTRVEKVDVKFAATPPPREYPIRAKLCWPVHGIGELANTSRIWAVNSLMS
jgi:hypothetical protein